MLTLSVDSSKLFSILMPSTRGLPSSMWLPRTDVMSLVTCPLDNVVRLTAPPVYAAPLSISGICRSCWSLDIATSMERLCCTSEHAASHKKGASRLANTDSLTKGSSRDSVRYASRRSLQKFARWDNMDVKNTTLVVILLRRCETS
jgi:hypothetical protein